MPIFNKQNVDNTKSALTATNLKTEHPEIFSEVHSMGWLEATKDVESRITNATEAGHSKGILEGTIKGATTERERIMAVSDKVVPGYEKQVREMMGDGKTTGPEASDKILMDMKGKRAKGYEAMREETELPLGNDHEAEANAQNKKEAAAANKGKDFQTLKKEYREKNKCTEMEALKACAKLYPNEYEKPVKR